MQTIDNLEPTIYPVFDERRAGSCVTRRAFPGKRAMAIFAALAIGKQPGAISVAIV